MTLEEMGNEYNEQWKVLMDRILQLRENAKGLKPELQRKQLRRINSLMDSAAVCKRCAEKLTNYYRRDE